MHLLAVTKIIFQLGLLCFFVVFFGKPSLEMYLEKQLLTVTSKKDSGKVMRPAITIVAFNSENGGWSKNVSSQGYEALKTVCGNSEDLEACIEQNTQDLDETILAVKGWGQNGIALTDLKLWSEDFTVPWYGRSHTFVYPEAQGASDWETDDIFLHVNKSDGLNRILFLHDPNYYIFNLKPGTLPNNFIQIDDTLSGNQFISLKLKERVEYNTPSDPCVEDSSYSFLACVKESLSAHAECRLPWDIYSSQERPVCMTNTLPQTTQPLSGLP